MPLGRNILPGNADVVSEETLTRGVKTTSPPPSPPPASSFFSSSAVSSTSSTLGSSMTINHQRRQSHQNNDNNNNNNNSKHKKYGYGGGCSNTTKMGGGSWSKRVTGTVVVILLQLVVGFYGSTLSLIVSSPQPVISTTTTTTQIEMRTTTTTTTMNNTLHQEKIRTTTKAKTTRTSGIQLQSQKKKTPAQAQLAPHSSSSTPGSSRGSAGSKTSTSTSTSTSPLPPTVSHPRIITIPLVQQQQQAQESSINDNNHQKTSRTSNTTTTVTTIPLQFLPPTGVTPYPGMELIPTDQLPPSFQACLPTTEIHLLPLPTPSDFSNNTSSTSSTTNTTTVFTLITLDSNGHVKTMGGDEFCIRFYPQHHGNHQPRNKNTIPHAVGLIQDLNNGRYEFTWHQVPMQVGTKKVPNSPIITYFNGTLVVELEYTCGVGRMHPMSKRTWTTGGQVNQQFQLTPWTVTEAQMVPFHFFPSQPPPEPQQQQDAQSSTSSPASSSSSSSTVPNDNNQNHNHNHNHHLVNFSQYDMIHVFGDSVLLQMVMDYDNSNWIMPLSYYRKDGLFRAAPNVALPLSTRTVNQWLVKLDTLPYLQELREYSQERRRKMAKQQQEEEEDAGVTTSLPSKTNVANSTNSVCHNILQSYQPKTRTIPRTTTAPNKKKKRIEDQKIALFLDSGVWDLLAAEEEDWTTTTTRTSRLGPMTVDERRIALQEGTVAYWDDHLQAVRQLLQAIHCRHPHVTLLWKSPTALQAHMVRDKTIRRSQYMSHSRVYQLYQLQKELIHELAVSYDDDVGSSSKSTMELAFVDLFATTYLAGHRLKPNDGRHYDPLFNQFMTNSLFL
jgi:hypothetical protein